MNSSAPEYIVHRIVSSDWEWQGGGWASTVPLAIDRFHSRSSGHRPVAQAKIAYDDTGLRVLFRVEDQYVRSVYCGYNQPVCRDSCVEFFVAPLPDVPGSGYINFEINCGGALHASHITDHTRTPKGFRHWTFISAALLDEITVHRTAPTVVDPERTEPMTWHIGLAFPWRVLSEVFQQDLTARPGAVWHANFYKCADQTSHPHWAAWSDIGAELNFHRPDRFGRLRFA